MNKSIERLQLESMVNRFGYEGVLYMLFETAMDKAAENNDEQIWIDIAGHIEKSLPPIHKLMSAKQGHSL